MNITRSFAALARAVLDNEDRPAVAGVHITPDGKTAVASDGRILAETTAPVNATPNRWHDVKALRKLAKKLRRDGTMASYIDGKETAVFAGRKGPGEPIPYSISECSSPFPDYNKLLRPRDGAQLATIALAPAYLRTLADMAKDAGAVTVHLAIVAEPEEKETRDAIFFRILPPEGEPIRGCLMPMFIDGTIDWRPEA